MESAARRVVSPCEQHADSVLTLVETSTDPDVVASAVADVEPANRKCEWKDLLAARRRSHQFVLRPSTPPQESVASSPSTTRTNGALRHVDDSSTTSSSKSSSGQRGGNKATLCGTIAVEMRTPSTATSGSLAETSPQSSCSNAPSAALTHSAENASSNPLTVPASPLSSLHRPKRTQRRVTMHHGEVAAAAAADDSDTSSVSSGGSWNTSRSAARQRRQRRQGGDSHRAALLPSLLAAPFAADENTFQSSPWTLRFHDPQLEADYCVFHVSGRPSILMSTLLALIMCPGFTSIPFVARSSDVMPYALIVPAWICFFVAFVASLLLSLRLSQLSFGMGRRNFGGRGCALFPRLLSQKSVRLHRAATWNALWQERVMLLPQLGASLMTAFFVFGQDDCLVHKYMFCLTNYRMAVVFFMITVNSLFLAPARFASFVPLTLSGVAVFITAAAAPRSHVNAEYDTPNALLVMTAFSTAAFWITAYVQEARRREDFVRECHLLEREMTVRYVRELTRMRVASQVPPEALQILRMDANTTESLGQDECGYRCLTCPSAVVVTLGIRGWGRWFIEQSPTNIANVLQSCHLRLDAVLASQSGTTFIKLSIVGDTCMLASGLHASQSSAVPDHQGGVTPSSTITMADRLMEALDLLLRILVDEPHPEPLMAFDGRYHSSRFTVCSISFGELCMQVVGRSAQVVFTGAAVADGAWLIKRKDGPRTCQLRGAADYVRRHGVDVLLLQSALPVLHTACVSDRKGRLWVADKNGGGDEEQPLWPSVWRRRFEDESFALVWSDATAHADGVHYLNGSIALTTQLERFGVSADEHLYDVSVAVGTAPSPSTALSSENSVSIDGIIPSDLQPVSDPLVDAADENQPPPWELVRDWVVVYRFTDADVERQYQAERASLGVLDPAPTRWAYVAATLVASGCLVASVVETLDSDIVISNSGRVPAIAWFSIAVALCCCGIAMTAPVLQPMVQQLYGTVPAYVAQRVFYTLAFAALVTPLYTLGSSSFFAENDATAICVILFASAALPQSASPFTLMLLDLLHAFPLLLLAASPYSEHRKTVGESDGPNRLNIIGSVSLMYGYYCFVVRVLVDRLHRGRFSTVKQIEAQAAALQRELTLLQELQSIMIPNALVSNMIDSVRATRLAATVTVGHTGFRRTVGVPSNATIPAQTRDATAFSTPVQDTAILVVAISLVERQPGHHTVVQLDAERTAIGAMWDAIDNSVALDSRVVKLKCTSRIGVIVDDSSVSDELSQAARLFEVAVNIRKSIQESGRRCRCTSRGIVARGVPADEDVLPRAVVSVVGVHGPAIGAVLGSTALSFDSLGATPLGALEIATELSEMHAAFLHDHHQAHGEPQDQSRFASVLWFSDSFFTRCEQAWWSLDVVPDDWSSLRLPPQTLTLTHGVRCRGVQFI